MTKAATMTKLDLIKENENLRAQLRMAVRENVEQAQRVKQPTRIIISEPLLIDLLRGKSIKQGQVECILSDIGYLRISDIITKAAKGLL